MPSNNTDESLTVSGDHPASALVLPSLAAFGPTLNLLSLDSQRYSGGYYAGSIAKRATQMIIATITGLIILVVPMSALSYAADSFAGVSTVTQHQVVPGSGPTQGAVNNKLPLATHNGG